MSETPMSNPMEYNYDMNGLADEVEKWAQKLDAGEEFGLLVEVSFALRKAALQQLRIDEAVKFLKARESEGLDFPYSSRPIRNLIKGASQEQAP